MTQREVTRLTGLAALLLALSGPAWAQSVGSWSDASDRLLTTHPHAHTADEIDRMRIMVYGITATEVPAPYTSQECSLCHYVDALNRPSQSKFACRWCGSVKHADTNAARVITQRRSLGLDSKWLGKAAILGVLVKLHTERFPRSLGTAADPRLDNPYFAKWARSATARMLKTQGVVRCA